MNVSSQRPECGKAKTESLTSDVFCSTSYNRVPVLFQMIDFFFNQFRINTVTPSGTNVSYLTKATCHLQNSDDDEQPQPDDTLVATA